MLCCRPAMTASTVRPLPCSLRRLLEARFGADLGGVRLHSGPAAARLAGQAGGLACALGGWDIFLGPLPRRGRGAILVHEIAHLLQQRLPGPPRPRAAEAEAHLAAAAILGGRRFRPRMALDPRVPACWGEAGHYYTVYFCALAAGIGDPIAYRLAFWAQMADEIEDLDAVPAGIAMAWEDVRSLPADMIARGEAFLGGLENAILRQVMGGTPFLDSPPLLRPEVPRFERSDAYFRWLDVQKGLHALTGRTCEAETRRRIEISLSYRPLAGQEFEFGLSLHPLGDSFAHRDDAAGRMFPPPLGHGLRGHAPDLLSPHRGGLYRRYVAALHEVLTRAAGTTHTAPLSTEETVAALATIIPPFPALSEDEIRALAMRPGREGMDPLLSEMRRRQRAAEPDEERQIAQIRALAAERLGQRLRPYAPERFESVAFDDFQAPPGIAVPRTLVQRAFELARAWAQ